MTAQWDTGERILAHDADLNRIAAAVLAYLARQPQPVPYDALLAAVADIAQVPAAHVATAISRIESRLVRDYSHGPARFALAGGAR